VGKTEGPAGDGLTDAGRKDELVSNTDDHLVTHGRTVW